MGKFLVISLLAVMEQIHAQELTTERDADVQDPADNLIDKMFDRTQRASEAGEGLDHALLGKTAQLAKSARLRPGHPVLKDGRDMNQWSFKVPHRMPKRSPTLRATQSQSGIKSGQQGTKPSGSPSFRSASVSAMSETLPVAKPMGLEPALDEALQPEPMSLKVDCAPEQRGGECDLTFQVKMTLEPAAAAAIRWKKARTKEGRPSVVLDSVAEDSEAYHRGMRSGMVLDALIGGSVRDENEVWEINMRNNNNMRNFDDAINMRNFNDGIRLARYPLTFVMLEAVEAVKLEAVRELEAAMLRVGDQQ
jgi:hypothetical protein